MTEALGLICSLAACLGWWFEHKLSVKLEADAYVRGFRDGRDSVPVDFASSATRKGGDSRSRR